MAYTIPTPTELQASYGEFASVPADVVQAKIDYASRRVSTAWLERDYPDAIMLLACHMLVAEGAVERANPNGDGTSNMTSSGPVKSFAVDGVSVSYAGTSSSSGSGGLSDPNGYGSTEYGRQFMALRRANFAGPLVA